MSKYDPIERQHDEGARAYAAALAYFELGPERSIAAVAQKFTKSSRLLKRWSSRFAWVARAAAYDLQQLERHRKLLEGTAERWAERDEVLRERRYQLAMSIIEKAERMLDFPLTITERRIRNEQTGEATVIIMRPSAWNLNTARLFLETGTKLALEAVRNESARDDAEEKGAVYEFLSTDFLGVN